MARTDQPLSTGGVVPEEAPPRDERAAHVATGGAHTSAPEKESPRASRRGSRIAPFTPFGVLLKVMPLALIPDSTSVRSPALATPDIDAVTFVDVRFGSDGVVPGTGLDVAPS